MFPILLILALAGLGSYMLAGQVAVYLARSEFDRASCSMHAADRCTASTPIRQSRAKSLRRTGEIYSDAFPNLC